MNRAKKSQIREITVQLAELKEQLNALWWELGEDLQVEKSIAIGKATHDLKSAIEHLVGVI